MPLLKVIVDKITVETGNVKTYHLRFKDPGASFDFKPGQFVMLAVPCVKDGRPQVIRRAYSIASSPTQKGSIDLLIKKAGLVTSTLDAYKGGEELEISGPFGMFLYLDTMSSNVMGIAAGVGLAPIWSIFKYIHDKQLPVNLTLLFSNMTPRDIVYGEEIGRLGKECASLKTVLSITRPHESSAEELAAWKGKTGRIDKAMIKELLDERHPDLFYICGVPDMVNDTVKHLKELGVEPSRIKTERF